jgi:anti-sigma B factor antagonist
MKAQSQTRDGVLFFSFSGALDSLTVAEAEQAAKAWLQEKPTRLAGNLEDLDYISSAGLRLIMMMAKQVRADGGEICLFNLQDTVQEVFEIAGFHQFVPLAEDEPAALKILGV